MEISSARENTLKKIREALRKPTSSPFAEHQADTEVYVRTEGDLSTIFAREFNAIQGDLIECKNRNEALLRLREMAERKGWNQIYCSIPGLTSDGDGLLTLTNQSACDAAVTDCEFLIARTGTIVLSAAQASGRIVSVFTPIHIVIATVDQLVYDIKDGIAGLSGRYGERLPSALIFASGPSRTGDIEKTLVLGVHGPVEVYVFLIDENRSAL